MNCSVIKTDQEKEKKHNFWSSKPILTSGEFVYKSTEIASLGDVTILSSEVVKAGTITANNWS